MASEIIEMYKDAAHTIKQYPVTSTAAVMHGNTILSDIVEDVTTNGSTLPTGGVYESVDLGLPSGRKWARMNVGANSETEHGDLFAWGATKPYRTGGVDNTGNYSASKAATIMRDLLPNEDAATMNMGKGWRMPTKADFDELIANTDCEWTSIGGVNGRKFMKKSDHEVYVFFPASGYYYSGSLYDRGSSGRYWARSYDSSTYAWALNFNSSVYHTSTNDRYSGFSVRGVRE